MANNERLIRPNWHVVTGINPETVHDVMEVLGEMQFRTVTEDQQDWIEKFELTAPHSLEIPVFFDQSTRDAQHEIERSSSDKDVFAVHSLHTYCWKHVYIVKEASLSAESPDHLTFRRLASSYRTTPHTIVGGDTIQDSALIISRHYESKLIDDMPVMGA